MAFLPACTAGVLPTRKEELMLDVIMLAIAAASFAALIGYAYLCERL